MPKKNKPLNPFPIHQLPWHIDYDGGRHGEDSEDGWLQQVLSIDISVALGHDGEAAHGHLEAIQREDDIALTPHFVRLAQQSQ